MGQPSIQRDGVRRGQALRELGAVGLGATAAGLGIEALLAQAAAAAPKHGTLKDIEHVVILIQENRSFDHYFGKLPGVRGFDDKKGRDAFFQKANGKTVHPFHLPSKCLPDLNHDWAPQHRSWNNGKMNQWLAQHDAVDGKDSSGVPLGPGTMGDYDSPGSPCLYG